MQKHSPEQKKVARELIGHFEANLATFQNLLTSLQNQISTSPRLAPHIHSLKWRTKTISSLEDKIYRKMDDDEKAGRDFHINKHNLFVEINDLAGLRILHLNTDQLPLIADGLTALFDEELYTLHEKPSARVWDDEARAFLTKLGFKIANKPSRPSFYTSVHYVIKPSKKTEITCEIQVRTLMEEVWGEVDHLLNYPHKTNILACREQIAALARATSTCSRLVDSILRSHEDLKKHGRRGKKKALPETALQAPQEEGLEKDSDAG